MTIYLHKIYNTTTVIHIVVYESVFLSLITLLFKSKNYSFTVKKLINYQLTSVTVTLESNLH